jgi:uncharacterized protein
MSGKAVLFIHGGGAGGYEADAKLAESLQQRLGAAYQVHYPRMPGGDASPSEWTAKIGEEIAAIDGEVILVGHSVGASLLLKHLAESDDRHPISGIFLLATPFWGGEGGWQYEGFSVPDDFPRRLPKDVPVFLYHNRDDEEAPFAHLALYVARLPRATVYEGATGGHQFDEDLSRVARDITGLNAPERR